jgi:hypothetical protein
MRKICTGIAVLALALAGGCKSKQERAEKGRESETQARREVQQPQRELGGARENPAQAHAQYTAEVRDRMSAIDSRIDALQQQSDAKSHDLATSARARRDELQRKLGQASSTPADKWDAYRKDVDDSLDSLEKDLGVEKK